MLPRVASALAKILNPIKPLSRPTGAQAATKSPDGGEGGHGTLGYEPPEDSPQKEPREEESGAILPEDGLPPKSLEKATPPAGLPLQPGLTQVIIDLNAHRLERSAGAAAQSYETGAKEQKKNAKLPKGSMLDKKVG